MTYYISYTETLMMSLVVNLVMIMRYGGRDMKKT